jgi:hypothetical protein
MISWNILKKKKATNKASVVKTFKSPKSVHLLIIVSFYSPVHF